MKHTTDFGKFVFISVSFLIVLGIAFNLSRRYNVSASAVVSNESFCTVPSGRPLRIMPLGDSVTELSPGYRKSLYEKLSAAGILSTYIGTNYDYGTGGVYPANHEGHGGYGIGPSMLYPKTIGANIGTYLASNDPDIILLLVGVNDYIFAGQFESEYDSAMKMGELLDTIHTLRPNTKVFVASLLPKYNYINGVGTLETSWGAPLNNALPGLTSNRAWTRFVDLHTLGGFNPNDWNGIDNIHPVDTGFEKIAQVWFGALYDCLTAVAPTPTMVLPTITPLPPTLTPIPTATLRPTSTALPTPTSSIRPTNTPTLKPTSTPTKVPTSTPTPITSLPILSGLVWNDTNGNGLQGANESGVSGVTIVLLNSSTGVALQATQSNSVGAFSFSKLASGKYIIGVVLPSGKTFTIQDASSNTKDSIDSDVSVSTGKTRVYTVTGTTSITTIGVGLK